MYLLIYSCESRQFSGVVRSDQKVAQQHAVLETTRMHNTCHTVSVEYNMITEK